MHVLAFVGGVLVLAGFLTLLVDTAFVVDTPAPARTGVIQVEVAAIEVRMVIGAGQPRLVDLALVLEVTLAQLLV